MIAAIVFIEFIFGDLFSEEAKKLSLKGAKFSSILTLSAMLLPVYTLFIFGVNYLIDNSSGSFVLLTAALFYGAIFLHGYAVHVVKLHSRKK